MLKNVQCPICKTSQQIVEAKLRNLYQCVSCGRKVRALPPMNIPVPKAKIEIVEEIKAEEMETVDQGEEIVTDENPIVEETKEERNDKKPKKNKNKGK